MSKAVDDHPVVVGGYVLGAIGAVGLVMFLIALSRQPSRSVVSDESFEQDPNVMRLLRDMDEGGAGT